MHMEHTWVPCTRLYPPPQPLCFPSLPVTFGFLSALLFIPFPYLPFYYVLFTPPLFSLHSSPIPYSPLPYSLFTPPLFSLHSSPIPLHSHYLHTSPVPSSHSLHTSRIPSSLLPYTLFTTRHHVGYVTKTQFRQCLFYLGLEASDQELSIMEMCFTDAKGFNYLQLLKEIDPGEKLVDTYKFRVTEVIEKRKRVL